MWYRRWLPALLLSLALAGLAGCQRAQPKDSKVLPPSLDLVRNQAKLALDNSAPSGQRAQARDDAMGTLVAFLRLPESLKVPQAEWEKPALPGGAPLIRYFTSGNVRVYAATLPGSGIVPPGERVAVQYVPGSGTPQAFEVALAPGGHLVAARALEEAGQVYVTLACAVGKGGGFVAHLQREARTGEFKLSPAAFKALPSTIGAVGLEVNNGFLQVTGAANAVDEWQPQFDSRRPLRLYLNGDVGLDWKNGFVLLDERNFNAFQGLATALDSAASKEDRTEAWDKATRKLPDYLREIESWSDEMTAKLPPGGHIQKDQAANLSVRIVSIAAPDFTKEAGFTVVQQRASGGMPSAQVLAVPGVVQDFRLIDHKGLPGLMIVSAGGSKNGADAQQAVSLYRLTGGNTWEPAPDWFGALPAVEGLTLQQPAGTADLLIQWPSGSALKPQVVMTPKAGPPSVQICVGTGPCLPLVWTGDRLGGSAWVVEALRRVSGRDAAANMNAAIQAVAAFLASPDARVLSGNDLAKAMGADQGVNVAVFEPDPATRVVGLPPNQSGFVPLFIWSEKSIAAETPSVGAVAGWVSARTVQAGGSRWLMIVGRSQTTAAALLYKWSGAAWVAVNALDERVDRMIGTTARIMYTPGQTDPVRGIWVKGGTDLSAIVAGDGSSVSFCENGHSCLTYQYDNKWTLK